MKTNTESEEMREEAWPVRPYYKRDLAEAYAPNISSIAALNRLALWIKLNRQLSIALLDTGYKTRQQVFTSLQVELIFKYLGRP